MLVVKVSFMGLVLQNRGNVIPAAFMGCFENGQASFMGYFAK